MSISRRARPSRLAVVAAAAVAAMLFVPGAASAQGIFDLFFGGNRQRTAAAQPGAALSYAEPGFGGLSSPTRITVHPAGWGGRVVAYCVRLCDGRFFPIQRHAGATPVQLCNALCPAAKTKIFTGSDIARAVASDGRRYADLDHAFAYRQKVAADCTCNGISTYGTAIIDVSDDPTLRTGDLVATKDGFLKFTGSHSQLRKGGAFTPVTLAEIRVTRRKIATTAVAAPNWRSSSVR